MVVLDLFPGAESGELTVTDTSFACRFRFLQPTHPEILPLLEEKLRGLLKEPPGLEAVEMAKAAAYAYFLHHDQVWKANAVREWAWTMIPMVRSGPFFDLYSGALYEGSWEGLAFQLLEAREEGGWVEIKGCAFFSKEELKAFIKKRKKWLKEKPWERAEELGLFLKGTTSLLPKGVELYHRLETFWRKAISSHGLAEVVLASRGEKSALALELGKGVASWGALHGSDLCHLYVTPHQMVSVCISSLQFIQQTFNMLQLNGSWVLFCADPFGLQNKQWKQEASWLTEALKVLKFDYTIDPGVALRGHPTVELQIEDTLGERFAGPYLTFGAEPRASIEYSLLGPPKRLIALLAEGEGNLMREERVKQLES